MAELSEHVAYLSQEIGPRPAGTEEEQRAALYISENLSNQAGLSTSLEDFQCNPDSTLPKALCFGVAVVVALLATIVSALALPAAIIGLICAVLVVAEAFDKPVLSRFMNKGVSQNVVAKYEPPRSPARSSRRRKVVVVANYDSGKIRRDLTSSVLSALPVVYWVELVAIVALPVLFLVRMVVSPEGAGLAAFNVFLAVFMVIAVLPVLSFLLEKTAEYNEAANCNAAGVAVMMEVANRVAASRDLPDEENAFIHGEAAAQSAGLVPEGAELVYEVAPSADADVDSSMESAAERLAAAKAAVAALSGKPVSATANVVVHEENVSSEQPQEDESSASETSSEKGNSPAAVSVPVENPRSYPAEPVAHEVPDWFKKGQEQAKRPSVEKPVQRSRYADALAAAEEEIKVRAQEEAAASEELSARLRTMRESVQAAAEAAGSHKTAVMPEVPRDIAAPAGSADPVSVQTPASSGDSPAAPVTSESRGAAPAEPAPAEQHAPIPVSVREVPVPAPAPSPLSAIPAIEPADDPDVSLRSAARPLTGAAEESPLAGIPSPADSIPTPAAKSGRRLVVPSIGEELPSPAGVLETNEGSTHAAARKRRAISLPNIGVSQELPRISMDDRGQAAPLSEDRPSHDGRVRNLSALIPSVAEEPIAQPSARTASESALLDALPSLSVAPTQGDPGLSGSISLAGSFSAMSATGAAAPLGEELLENTTVDDLYIDDVDDSAYAEQATETGAMAGPGYVEMPKSRFGRLFGKLRRKEKEQVSTPQQWLDVEDDFEAREVGAARGGWESFREEESADLDQTTAFTPEFIDEAFKDDGLYDDERGHSGRSYQGGAYTPEDTDGVLLGESVEPVEAFAEGLPADFVFEAQPNVEAIEQFHQKRVDVEVWFVALGSELAGNGGMKAFMDAHAAELKGSIIIELQGLGAGELTLVDKEGTFLPKKASSRMKRLVKKAGQAVGLSVPTGTMEWMNSAAAYALKHGQQSMHLAGMAAKKPAFFAEADDIVENIDADQLALNADFVMELLHHI